MLNIAAKQRIFPQTLQLFFYHSRGELNCKMFFANTKRIQARGMSRLHGKVIRRYQNEMRARVVEEHRRQQETDVEAELNLVDSIAARNLILVRGLTAPQVETPQMNNSYYSSTNVNVSQRNEVIDDSRIELPLSPRIPVDDSNTNPAESRQLSENAEDSPLIEAGQISDVDRGYFVRDGEIIDDYVAGTARDLPDEEAIESPFSYHGNVDEALEDIQLQLPGQSSVLKKKSKSKKAPSYAPLLGDNDTEQQQTPNAFFSRDESNELSTRKCAGCGAGFQCQNPSLPGFISPTEFDTVEKETKRSPLRQRTDRLCRRCHLHKHYNFLLNVNVCSVDYDRMMSHLRLVQDALILLVVDMADLEGSIYRALPQTIGRNKPMIVIGNKVDLLPPDSEPGFLKHYRSSLEKAIRDAGIASQFNILKYVMVSAKTGFGVEDLISTVFLKWIGAHGILRGNIYVVGCTNAGKSTLFNTFLQSDLCKVRALDIVERVTTSIWPGTTLSLLKFPLMNPTPLRLELRRRRLLTMQAWIKKERLFLSTLLRGSRARHSDLRYQITNSFKDMEEESNPTTKKEALAKFHGDVEQSDEEGEETTSKKFSLNSKIFTTGRYCFDTPGVSNDDKQVLSKLTLDELINVIPRSTFSPRIFIVQPGLSLLIGGLGRVDLLQPPHNDRRQIAPIYMTVFASRFLPINTIETKKVDTFVRRFIGTPVLGAPLGDTKRLDIFPKLESADFCINTNTIERKNAINRTTGTELSNDTFDETAEVKQATKSKNATKFVTGAGGVDPLPIADIVLSSIGWVMLSTPSRVNTQNCSIYARAWTPGGVGLYCRQPPLVPFALKYRGNRLPGTNAYKTLTFDRIDQSKQHRNNLPQRRATSPVPNFDLGC